MASSMRKAIMVLDDEGDITVILKKSLELAGHTVFAFTDPVAAFEHLEGNAGRYGLVISDIRMPKMSGIEFARKARAIAPSVSMVLMSAFNLSELQVPPELNVAEVLQKPVMPSQLKELVDRLVPVTHSEA